MMPGRAERFLEPVFGGAGVMPRHLRKVFFALWENPRELPHAWKILAHGVCDGCSIGSHGLRDALGLHLCASRLDFLQENTMAPIALAKLGDIDRLRGRGPQRLHALGRLAFPMIRRKGQRGFLRISWNEAMEIIAKEIRRITPNELSFLAAPRGQTNEVFYIFQKLARALGTNNIDLFSRLHGPDPAAPLKAQLGFAASTCSLADAVGTDLLVIFGPESGIDTIMEPYLRRATRTGAHLIRVNSSRDTLLGTESLEHGGQLQLRPGGDVAFISGVLKFLLLSERVHLPFVERHTYGFTELVARLEAFTWEQLEHGSGVEREAMQRFAESYSRARNAVFICTRALATSECMHAIANLALARGMIGRQKCGILVLRAESGEQGAVECGMGPDTFPGGYSVTQESARRFSNLWHHPILSKSGLDASGMIDAATEGRIKVLYTLGCDPIESAFGSGSNENAIMRIPLRLHQTCVLSASMLLDPAETVVLLPGQTLYEQRTGGILTNTERIIRFTPEIAGHAIGEALPNWEIPILIARKAMSNGDKLFPFDNTGAIREEMSRVMPIYENVEQLAQEGDELQWGGQQLYKDGFGNMPGGRALFHAPDLSE